MTNEQLILSKYILKKYGADTEVSFQGSIAIVNNEFRITLNIYGDILNADSREIIAEANVTHELMEIKEQIPTSWKAQNIDVNSLNVQEYYKRHKASCSNWNQGDPIEAWYDENNIVCVKYNGGEWYHYSLKNDGLEWW